MVVLILRRTFFLFSIILVTLAFFAFSMNYVVGFGYSPTRSWVFNFGAMNGFNGELFANVFTTASTSQCLTYKVEAHVPLLGRNEKNTGFRFGPTFETTVASNVAFEVGFYGQYYVGPWRIGAYILKPLDKSDFHFSFDLWYFFSSNTHHFLDYFIASIKMDKELPYFSLIFVEPF